MIRVLLRQASKNSPFSNDWGQNSGNEQLGKRVSISFTCYRENMIFNLNVTKAKFQLRDNYFTLKSRGYMVAEFIPLASSPQDPTRKIFLPKEKYTTLINNESVYSLLHEKQVKIVNKREKENELFELNAVDGSDGWEWTIFKGGNPENKRKIVLQKSESFYVKEFIKHSIQYVMGWYALGDTRLTEQNLHVEQEMKDPFENV